MGRRNLLCLGTACLLLNPVACLEVGENEEGEEGTCSAKNLDACSHEQQENLNVTQQLTEEGNALAGKEDYTQALKMYKLALQIDNKSTWSANPMINAGLAMKSLGQVDEGIDMLRAGVKLNPKLFHGQYNLGNLMAERKGWGEADEAYRAALAVATPDMTHHVTIAYIRLLLQLYHYEEGRSALAGRDILYELSNLAVQLTTFVKKMDKPAADLVSLCSNVFNFGRKKKEGDAFNEWAVKQGIWRDVRQRPSSFNDHMFQAYKATPWWKSDTTHDLPDFLEEISDSWKKLAKEYDTLLKNGKLLQPEDDGQSDFQFYDKSKGHEWLQLELFLNGNKNFANAKIAKAGARLFGDTQIKGDSEGRVFYSAMKPGTHTIPRCGITNIRITCYLGLRVPNVDTDKLGISVAGEVRGVRQGAWECFDDSFEHTIWNEADEVFGAVVAQFKHPAMPKKRA